MVSFRINWNVACKIIVNEDLKKSLNSLLIPDLRHYFMFFICWMLLRTFFSEPYLELRLSHECRYYQVLLLSVIKMWWMKSIQNSLFPSFWSTYCSALIVFFLGYNYKFYGDGWFFLRLNIFSLRQFWYNCIFYVKEK